MSVCCTMDDGSHGKNARAVCIGLVAAAAACVCVGLTVSSQSRLQLAASSSTTSLPLTAAASTRVPNMVRSYVPYSAAQGPVMQPASVDEQFPQVPTPAQQSGERFAQVACGTGLGTVLVGCLMALISYVGRRQTRASSAAPSVPPYMATWRMASIATPSESEPEPPTEDDVIDVDSTSVDATESKGPMPTASDKARMEVVNEIRREFHRTLSPLTSDSEAKETDRETEQLSNSALLLTRMMRITAEKASTEVQLVSDERPSDSWTLPQALEFLVQPSSKSLRDFLATEAAVAVDLALRKNIIAARAKVKEATANLPIPNDLQLPFLLPEPSGTPRMVMLNPDVLLDTIAPKLSSVEEEYAYALEQLYTEVYGADLAELFNGKSLDEPQEFVQRVISSFTSNVSNGGETANMLTPAFWSGLRDRLQEGELGELQAALRTLTDSDRQVLQGWTKEVLEMGWDTTLARIQYLGK